ncbi:hypothetical protein [Citrobacter portucalensis]|uniref:capsular polysaccharide export protein, LipB/KpsS family n=1 Tax=Citrobacter portucalensis TaxID=1639133 RepID=UPI00301D2378
MVYFFLYSGFRFNLYTALANKYLMEKKEIRFVVQDLNTYTRLISKGVKLKNILVIRLKNLTRHADIPELFDNIDVLSENMSYKYACKLYWSTIEFLNSLGLKSTDILFCGNGSHVQDLAIKKYQIDIKYETMFSELANIDGKTFFDPVGANCNSLFYKLQEENISELKSSYNYQRLNDWELNYVQNKKNKHIIRQAKRRSLNELLIYYVLTVLEIILLIPSYDSLRVRSGLTKVNVLRRKKYKGNLKKTNNDTKEYGSTNFMFFPLQVTNDAQVLINSDYNNVQALKYYIKMSRSMGLELVVKVHPAERNAEFINKIKEMIQEEDGVYISNRNTFELILGSKCVGVNNSTVGFEAIICGKETFFIGKTFYSKLVDPVWRYYYIYNYLINIDSFTGVTVENNIISKLNDLVKMKEKVIEHGKS